MDINRNAIIYKNINDKELSVQECLMEFAEVTIPEKIIVDGQEYTVTEIGTKAFQDCSILNKIILPDSIKKIGKGAFAKCTCLQMIHIPRSVQAIEDYAFFECKNLENIYFDDPCKLLSIGFLTFYKCVSLKSIFLPSSIKKIRKKAFNQCDNLERVNFSSFSCLSEIEEEVFAGCRKLKPIEMPNSIKQIGSHAFSACFKYDSVLIPKNIERIDISAFFNTKIISIYVDSDNKFYDSRDNCNAIIETCSNKLITGCVNTVIPKSVRIVDISGFANYELKQIKIPETVEKIEMTFEGLGFLEKIFVPANKKAYFMSQLSSYFWDALDVY